MLQVRDLRFTYADGTAALNGVDFDLHERESVALLGANGSGKTTFVLHLNGLLRGEGSIQVGGLELTPKTAATVRSRVGIVFQDSDNQLFMPTVAEDVAFGPRNQGMSIEQAHQTAMEALERVGIPELAAKAPFHLSAGQKKRAAIAGILAMSPHILILDEPTTFLDPPARKSLVKLLRELPQPKIMVTHDIPFALMVAQSAVFFDRGRIVARGTVREVAKQAGWLDETEDQPL